MEDNNLYKKEKLGTLWNKLNWNNVTREGGVSFPNGQKPEQLLKILISTFTNENDIVLDYHLGSGTTCAVALKMNRRFIGIEQLDYGKNDSVIRLQNVIGKNIEKNDELIPSNNYDQTGVSKDVKWQGGGSFTYCELSKANQEYIDKINETKDAKSLLKIWKKMQDKAFISYKVDIKTINASIDEFEKLPFKDQKRFLIETLDKNMLYVPYSEIDDVDYSISDEDKKLNHKFYGGKA
nr:site-specific DNA-methyltransferase [Salinispira pacifica]